MQSVLKTNQLTAATMLLSEILLADAEADPELNPEAEKAVKDLPNTKRLQVAFLMLDGIDEKWLVEQINNAERYESVGFIFSKPLDYSQNIGDTPRIKETARLCLKLKQLRAEQLEEQAKRAKK